MALQNIALQQNCRQGHVVFSSHRFGPERMETLVCVALNL
jgi:hypothetical protein